MATNDAHYLGCDDHGPHEALLCVGTGSTLDDPNRFRFTGQGFYLKSGPEMAELFHDHPTAVANTMEIAERCNLEIDMGQFHLPEFQVPAGTTREEVLEGQAWSGLRRRLGLDSDAPFADRYAQYVTRMKHELHVIQSMKYAGYFLIVSDFIDYARRNSIPVGPGRGLDASYQREQLLLEVLMDVRDAIHSIGDAPNEKSAIEKLQALKNLTKLR